MTLTEFLLARIDEDRVRATLREWHDLDCETIPNSAGYSYPCECGVPERMARECAAKRAIVELHHVNEKRLDSFPDEPECYLCSYELRDDGSDYGFPCLTVRHLALVYADHPDYRAEWAD